MALLDYTIPITITVFLYFKLIYYVKQMSKRVTSANVLYRAQRELNMIRRVVILVMILFAFGILDCVFFMMIVFNDKQLYDWRIGSVSMDVSVSMISIVLIQFTEPLKTAIMKRIKRRPNMVVARVA